MHPQLWALPFSVTEAGLPHGSCLARRVPDTLARLLRARHFLDARWAALVTDVEEGLAYAVHVAATDDLDPREQLANLGGDFLLYGQFEIDGSQVWLDARLFSRAHDEVLLYPYLAGDPAGFLAALPGVAGEIAGALGHAAASEPPGEQLLTRSWTAFEHYCEALDSLTPERHEPEEDSGALRQLVSALRIDPQFGLAALLGLEMAALGAESLEHSLDLVDVLARASPDLPEIPDFRAALYRRLGRQADAEREEAHARQLRDRRRDRDG